MKSHFVFGFLLFAVLSCAAQNTPSTQPSSLYDNFNHAFLVNCDRGQSLNATLAKMNKFSPGTVVFTGTCTEYVVVDGFDNLTLTGVQGATIQQPNTPPPPHPAFVLSVKASRSVTLSGFAVHSQPSVLSCIGIGGGSTDTMVREVTTDGS